MQLVELVIGFSKIKTWPYQTEVHEIYTKLHIAKTSKTLLADQLVEKTVCCEDINQLVISRII